MTNKELEILFQITSMIKQDDWFKTISLEESQAWVAKQIAESSLHIYTTPVGSNWGSLNSKDKYEEYYDTKRIK